MLPIDSLVTLTLSGCWRRNRRPNLTQRSRPLHRPKQSSFLIYWRSRSAGLVSPGLSPRSTQPAVLGAGPLKKDRSYLDSMARVDAATPTVTDSATPCLSSPSGPGPPSDRERSLAPSYPEAAEAEEPGRDECPGRGLGHSFVDLETIQTGRRVNPQRGNRDTGEG